MGEIERRLAVPDDTETPPPPEPGQLLALVDALREGTLNAQQQETVYALRTAILSLGERQTESD